MCVIIHAPAGKSLPKEILRNCFDHNTDGYGIMYSEDNELKIIRGVAGFDKFYQDWIAIPRDLERAIHFRFATHGEVNAANCHPFMPMPNIGMMHNGVLDVDLTTPAMSDTFNFTAHMLAPLMSIMQDPFDEAALSPMVSKITEGSRLLFMNNEGKVWITADEDWTDAYGCRFSNAYSMTKVYAPYKGGYGGKYGSGFGSVNAYEGMYGHDPLSEQEDYYAAAYGAGSVGSDIIGTMEKELEEIEEKDISMQLDIEEYIDRQMKDEDSISYSEIMELSVEDLCDYVQDNPWSTTFIIRELLGMDANNDLIEDEQDDDAEIAELIKAA